MQTVQADEGRRSLLTHDGQYGQDADVEFSAELDLGLMVEHASGLGDYDRFTIRALDIADVDVLLGEGVVIDAAGVLDRLCHVCCRSYSRREPKFEQTGW